MLCVLELLDDRKQIESIVCQAMSTGNNEELKGNDRQYVHCAVNTIQKYILREGSKYQILTKNSGKLAFHTLGRL